MRRAVEGALHNVPADCPSSYLYILSRQYLRWAQFQVANEDYSAEQSNPKINVRKYMPRVRYSQLIL
jgi:hypothetical protein